MAAHNLICGMWFQYLLLKKQENENTTGRLTSQFKRTRILKRSILKPGVLYKWSTKRPGVAITISTLAE
ncbi:unnamed protein product [Schistosoma curassoni]|uniref:Ovule protein n=1 Tax=Schistosoma curassoni TaxID=6186 RepID=A0A183JKW0_9TREM|nr:unnamed protein product [Schistosoma curassoni]